MTDVYVAYLVEGLAANVEEASEQCPPACVGDVTQLVIDEVIDERRFETWSLVYLGEVEYVTRKIEAVLQPGMDVDERASKAGEIVQMMRSFAEA